MFIAEEFALVLDEKDIFLWEGSLQITGNRRVQSELFCFHNHSTQLLPNSSQKNAHKDRVTLLPCFEGCASDRIRD